jgi:hypothetical protein
MRSPLILAAGLVACFPSSPAPPPGPPPAAVALAPVAAPAPVTAAVRIELEIDPTKADGRAWDAGGEPPDLAICLTSAGATKCLPMGTSVATVTAPACRDAYRCSFAEVALAPGTFQVQVIDVDALANDVAGQAACTVGTVCRVGQATLTASAAGTPVAAAPPVAPGIVPPTARQVIARLRQAIATRDMLALRGMLADDGEFAIGPGLVAETGQAAAEAWRTNPATLAELDALLAQPCDAEEDDDMMIVTCPRVSESYEGPIAVIAEEDEDVYQLVGFMRP